MYGKNILRIKDELLQALIYNFQLINNNLHFFFIFSPLFMKGEKDDKK